MYWKRPLLVAAVFLASAASPAWARFEPVTCKNAFTVHQEITEGNKVALEVYKQMPVLPDNDPVSRYIQDLGNRLVRTAPVMPGVQHQWPFNFHVVASADINAFALPGGTVFVNLGTIQAAETEAQLAGVMAHELSHVVMRHSTCNIAKQRNKSILYGLGQIGAAVLLGNGAAGQAAQAGLGIGQSLDFLRMSRTDEEQADLLGVNLLEQANYDPRGLPQFFEIIQAKTGNGPAQFLSDHPNPGNRTQYVNAEIDTLPRLDHPLVRTQAFTQMKSIAAQRRALTAEDVKGGQWKNSGQYTSQPGTYPQQQQSYPQQRGDNSPQQQQGNSYPQQQQSYPQQQGNNYPQQQGNNYPQQQQNYPQQGNQTTQSLPSIAPIPRTRLGLRDRMTGYQAPRWSIRYPSSWRATTDPNSSNQNQQGSPSVTFAPSGGSGTFGVAYGVLVGVARPQDTTQQQDNDRQQQNNNSQQGYGPMDSNSLSAAASAIVQRFLSGDSGLTQSSGMRSVRVGNLNAFTVELAGDSPVSANRSAGGQHQRERDTLVVIARPDGDVSYLVFVAPQGDFQTLKPVFDSMLTSFTPQ